MTDDGSRTPVEADVPAANAQPLQATRLLLQQRSRGFTLAELLVSTGVLVLLVLLGTQLLKSGATVATLGNKQMDADSQARQLLDRMAIDFAQMVKRSDVDYYVKSSASAPLRSVLQLGNDQIAFYSTVPGYYPSSGSQSPVSLVAYRINSYTSSSAYNKLERMGKGLVWNGVSTTDTPVVFLPLTISGTAAWSGATKPSPDPNYSDPDYEVAGPQVFRFEYYYLLKSRKVGDTTYPPYPLNYTPWDITRTGHTALNAFQDVSAIAV